MISFGDGISARSVRRLLPLAFAWLLAGPPLRAADSPSPSGDAQQSNKSRADDGRPDKSRRDAILNSEAWRTTLGGLDEWFSAQTIYDREQVGEIEQQLTSRLRRMSADELEAFQQDLDAKLGMALGPEGRDILGWVSANLAAAAPAYRQKMDLQYPDLLKLTAAQFREQLDRLARKRSAARSQTAVLEQSRQARIASLLAEQRKQDQDRERALSRDAANLGPGGYRSHYHPGGSVRKYPEVVSRPAYGFGFGYGFGFW